MDEFVPQRTSAYTSQYDLHAGEMTVRETLDFSARCQGVGGLSGQFQCHEVLLIVLGWKNSSGWEWICFKFGYFADMLAELSRREKAANIKPDPDIDIYMKVLRKHS